MTRDTAWLILTRHVTNPVLLKHSLATEAVMRALAIHFEEDPTDWTTTGLLHDADYEKAKGRPEQHGMLLSHLEPNAIPSTVEHAIQAHNYEWTHVMPQSRMDWAITCCDELTGIIMALGETTPDKTITSLSPSRVIEKLQDKHFAKGASRKNIFLCQEKLGIPLSEFVNITLTAMQQIAQQLET